MATRRLPPSGTGAIVTSLSSSASMLSSMEEEEGGGVVKAWTKVSLLGFDRTDERDSIEGRYIAGRVGRGGKVGRGRGSRDAILALRESKGEEVEKVEDGVRGIAAAAHAAVLSTNRSGTLSRRKIVPLLPLLMV